jgi:hypothetical protein
MLQEHYVLASLLLRNRGLVDYFYLRHRSPVPPLVYFHFWSLSNDYATPSSSVPSGQRGR